MVLPYGITHMLSVSQNILQIIQEVTEVNVIITSHQIEASLKRLVNDFDLMFEPTAVPRPGALGRSHQYDQI